MPKIGLIWAKIFLFLTQKPPLRLMPSQTPGEDIAFGKSWSSLYLNEYNKFRMKKKRPPQRDAYSLDHYEHYYFGRTVEYNILRLI